jgi:hypothetical protein
MYDRRLERKGFYAGPRLVKLVRARFFIYNGRTDCCRESRSCTIRWSAVVFGNEQEDVHDTRVVQKYFVISLFFSIYSSDHFSVL